MHITFFRYNCSPISKYNKNSFFFKENNYKKHNHCCNPYQRCGGEVKLAFAAKKNGIGSGFGSQIP